MLNRQQLIIQLKKGMEHLTFEEKTALQLAYYEDLTDNEICEVMNVSHEKIGIIIGNAKLKMRAFTTIFDDIDDIGRRGIKIMNK